MTIKPSLFAISGVFLVSSLGNVAMAQEVTPTPQLAATTTYSSCEKAAAAGVSLPIHRGDAAYSTNLDRDGDGIACESSKALPNTPTKQAPAIHYANCDAAREAGAAPLGKDDPGYGIHLDRDGDGLACEGGSSNSEPVINNEANEVQTPVTSENLAPVPASSTPKATLANTGTSTLWAGVVGALAFAGSVLISRRKA